MTDTETLARTLYGEAEAGNEDDARAIAAVVMNRVRLANWPGSVAEVCTQPWQFSCWNQNDPNRERILKVTRERSDWFRRCWAIAEEAVAGDLDDPTLRATHYYATWVRTPAWAKGKRPVLAVSHRGGHAHRFFNDIDTPPPRNAREALDQQHPLSGSRTERGGKAAVAGGALAGIAALVDELTPVLPMLETLATRSGMLTAVAVALVVAGAGYALHARRDDRLSGKA